MYRYAIWVLNKGRTNVLLLIYWWKMAKCEVIAGNGS